MAIVTLAVTSYQWFLAAHILMAAVWVGGNFMIQVFAFRIQRADDPLRLAAFTKDIEWIGSRVITVSALIGVAFGFLLVSKGDWGYPFWVIFGIIGFAVSALLGSLFLGPESGRIGKLVEAKGAADPEVTRRIRRILVYSRLELVLLVLVLIDMAIKPFS